MSDEELDEAIRVCLRETHGREGRNGRCTCGVAAELDEQLLALLTLFLLQVLRLKVDKYKRIRKLPELSTVQKAECMVWGVWGTFRSVCLACSSACR